MKIGLGEEAGKHLKIRCVEHNLFLTLPSLTRLSEKVCASFWYGFINIDVSFKNVMVSTMK